MSKRWMRLEQDVAKDINGHMQPGSGRFPGAREDVISALFLVQCKSSISDSVRPEYNDLFELSEAAKQIGRIPVLVCLERCASNKAYTVAIPYAHAISLFEIQGHTTCKEFKTEDSATFSFPFEAVGGVVHFSGKGKPEEWTNALIVTRDNFKEMVEREQENYD